MAVTPVDGGDTDRVDCDSTGIGEQVWLLAAALLASMLVQARLCEL